MSRYLVRRLVMIIPVVFGVITLVFALIHMIPGDPVESWRGPNLTEKDLDEIRASLNLDKPIYEQYLLYLNKLIHLDLGISLVSGQTVNSEIRNRFVTTIKLTIGGIGFALLIGPILGIISALYPRRFIDYVTSGIAILGFSIPDFWLGMILMLVFAERLHWLPSLGIGSLRHWILPSITLGLAVVGMLARMMRAFMLEVLNEPYITTARAKGIPERLVLIRHALKNAMIPMVTIIGLRAGYMLAGAMVTETVFSIPGLGRLMVSSVLNKDFPMVQGAVLVTALAFIFLNLFVDIIYTVIDPKVRLQ
jgi:ABC-type dipeptide/oligopeptide/nickel transport system permease component